MEASPGSSVYKPLDTSRREIRLLEINKLPATKTEKQRAIRCSLKQVALREAPPFNALSYVWGGDESSCTVQINDEYLSVRKNLWDFLQALVNRFSLQDNAGRRNAPISNNGSGDMRQIAGGTNQQLDRGVVSDDNVIRVFVDAICINQHDTSERSSQVSMMGDVYRSAAEVWAWLGEGTPRSNQFFKLCDNIHKSHLAYGERDSKYKRRLAAMYEITVRSYWSRLWIVQEVLMATHLRIFCGQCSATDEAFRKVIIAVTAGDDEGARNPIHPLSLIEVYEIMEMRRNARNKLHLRMPTLLQQFRQHNCSDDRDRIYGLLSLIHPDVAELIQVDYSKSVLQVFLETLPLWVGPRTIYQEIGKPTRNSLHASPYRILDASRFIVALTERLTSALPAKDCQPSPAGYYGRPVLYSLRLSRATSPALVSEPSFTTFAVADLNNIVALADIGTLTSGSGPLVYVSSVADPYTTLNEIIFTPMLPQKGDLLFDVSFTTDMVWLLRKQRDAPKTRAVLDQASEPSIHFAGFWRTSTNFWKRGVICLRDRRVPDPRHWLAQQDWTASWGLASSNHDGSNIDVVCNVPAIGSILRWRSFFTGQSLAEPSDNLFSWDPYDFGMRHGLLKPCTLCQSQSDSRAQSPRQFGQQCGCKWG